MPQTSSVFDLILGICSASICGFTPSLSLFRSLKAVFSLRIPQRCKDLVFLLSTKHEENVIPAADHIPANGSSLVLQLHEGGSQMVGRGFKSQPSPSWCSEHAASDDGFSWRDKCLCRIHWLYLRSGAMKRWDLFSYQEWWHFCRFLLSTCLHGGRKMNIVVAYLTINKPWILNLQTFKEAQQFSQFVCILLTLFQ